LSGCGYKANPYNKEDAVMEDKNIKFIIKNSDTNMSANKSINR